MALVVTFVTLYMRSTGLKQVLQALLVIPYRLSEMGFMCPTLVGCLVSEEVMLSVCRDLSGTKDTLQSSIELLSEEATDGMIPLCPLLIVAPRTCMVFVFSVVRQARLRVGVRMTLTTGPGLPLGLNLNRVVAIAYLST